jgi:hypothetical protein
MESLVTPIIIFSLGVLILGIIYLALRPKRKDNPKIGLLLKFCSYGISLVFLVFISYVLVFSKHDPNEMPFSEFKSFSLQWGPGDSLINKYDSRTGNYQFVDSHDALIKMNVHLPKELLLVLHREASELGFWSWREREIGDTTERLNGMKPLRFVMQFNYQRKSKTVTFDESFIGDPRLKAANEQMIKEIKTVLDDEAAKQK